MKIPPLTLLLPLAAITLATVAPAKVVNYVLPEKNGEDLPLPPGEGADVVAGTRAKRQPVTAAIAISI